MWPDHLKLAFHSHYVPPVVLIALKLSGRLNIHVEGVRQKLGIEATEYVVSLAHLSFVFLTTLATVLSAMLLLAAVLLVLLVTLSLMLVLWVTSEVEVLNPHTKNTINTYNILYTCMYIYSNFARELGSVSFLL